MTAPASGLVQDERSLRDALGRFATGVAIISAQTASGPVGMAVNSFTSVSLDPPLIAFCPMRTSRSWAAIRRAGSFSVSVLGEHHEEVARLLASKSNNKFGTHVWDACTSGHPVLPDALAWFDATIDTTFDGGDHEVVLARVTSWSGSQDGTPLVFFGGKYRSLNECG
ncbi:flavin reductase family protein [Paenarthrobacter nitroguajacolicus]|uniref:flavin reductase family protein n=1 Tax=Paenarthrobacter nitroguajacolicus TaxID=211146 RepID=UPI0034128FE1